MTNSSRTRASTQPISGFYRFRVGEFDLAVVSDGTLEIDPNVWGSNALEGQLPALLQQQGIDVDVWDSGLHCLLIDTGTTRVLVDSGAGQFAMPGADPNAGKLLPTLSAMGVAPESIEHVIVTHYHPDHVGNLSLDGKAAFPNATYWLSKIEADYIENATEDPFTPFAQQKLAPIKANDQLKIFEAGETIIPGIKTLPAPGHTPGHIVLMIGEGEAKLFHMVDVAPNPVVSLTQPDWYFMFDSDPEQGVKTRHQMLGKAADENLLVMSYHFPFPALGYIVRDGDTFRYTPTS